MTSSSEAGTEARGWLWPIVWAFVPALVLTYLVWTPFFRSPTLDNSFHDWSFRSDYAGYTVHAVFDEHVMPYWSTSLVFDQLRAKGNHGFFANPETEVFSPFIVLYRWFNFTQATKIALAIHLIIGVWGTCVLCVRGFGLREPIAVCVVAQLLFCSGFFTQHFLIGHAQFASYCYFPLAFYLFLRASALDARSVQFGAPSLRRRVYSAAGAAALLACCVYEGNVHLLIHFWMFLGGYTVLRLLFSWGRERGLLLGFGALLPLFVLLAAYKLVPMLFEYGHYRSDYVIRYDSVPEFVNSLLHPEFWLVVPRIDHERALYFGRVGVGLLVIAFLVPRRATLPLAILSVVFLVLCFCPYEAQLRDLPLMRTQGAFTRFRGMFVFANLCLLAATLHSVFRWLAARSSRWPVYIARLALVACSLYLTYDLSRPFEGHVRIFSRWPIEMPVVHPEAPQLVPEWQAAPSHALLQFPPGVVSPERIRANAFSYNYQGMASPAAPVILWGPELELAKMGKKLRIVGDGELTELRDHLAVRLTTPNARFSLRYMPWYVVCSGLLTLLTVLGLVGFALWVSLRGARPTAR